MKERLCGTEQDADDNLNCGRMSEVNSGDGARLEALQLQWSSGSGELSQRATQFFLAGMLAVDLTSFRFFYFTVELR